MVMRAISSGQILPPKSGYPQQKCLSPRAPPLSTCSAWRLARGPDHRTPLRRWGFFTQE